MPSTRRLLLTLGALLALGACGAGSEAPLPDNALLADDIRVDGDRLADKATLSGSAAERRACADRVEIGDGWADLLPAAFPVFPGATLTEAGGVAGECDLRVVSFRTDASVERVLGWYADRATKAGYSADRERRGADRLLGGTKGDDAFVVTARAAGRTTEVDLVANAGR